MCAAARKGREQEKQEGGREDSMSILQPREGLSWTTETSLRRLDLSWATSPAPASMSGLLGSMLLSMLHANMMLCSITQHHAQQCCEASLYTIKLFLAILKCFNMLLLSDPRGQGEAAVRAGLGASRAGEVQDDLGKVISSKYLNHDLRYRIPLSLHSDYLDFKSYICSSQIIYVTSTALFIRSFAGCRRRRKTRWQTSTARGSNMTNCR